MTWQTTPDDGSQRRFYYDADTKETSGEDPLGLQPVAPPASPLPPAAPAALPVSSASPPPPPPADANPIHSVPIVYASPVLVHAPAPAPALPSAWNQTRDAQGRAFWYNTETKETSWTSPFTAGIPIHVAPGQLQPYSTDPRALPLGHQPFPNVTCPGCQRLVTAQVEQVWGPASCALCCICCCVFWPLCFLPLCVDAMKDAEHHCPYCRTLIRTVDGNVLGQGR